MCCIKKMVKRAEPARRPKIRPFDILLIFNMPLLQRNILIITPMEMAVRICNAAGDGIHNAAGTAKVVTLGDGRSEITKPILLIVLIVH
jgi:hypothetical protein